MLTKQFLTLGKSHQATMNKILTLFVILLASTQVKAQNYVDLFKFDYAYSTESNFDDTVGTTVLQEMNGNLTVPIKLNDNVAILSGVTYEMMNTSFNPNTSNTTISGLTLKAGVNIKHNDKWCGTYMLLPKLSSDFKNVGSKDFQFGGAVLMKYTKSENFNYKFGVYANSELFGPMIVPILGLYYLSPSKKFEAKLLLPLSADANYEIANNLKLGLNFKGQVRTYNLNRSKAGPSNEYVARSANEAYTYLQYEMDNGINFMAGFGRSIGRSYRVYDDQVNFGIPLTYFGDNRTQLNTDFSDSWLFKVGAIYRLHL